MNDSTPQRNVAGTKDTDIVVFMIRKEATCSECGRELFGGAMLRLEEGNPLCLECADLDHLEFLPSGDAALTRRAGKHSTLKAVVVRWSRTRKRYERQGTLVESAALEQAEAECAADAPDRARRRAEAAVTRAAQDREYVAAFAAAIRRQFPGCPRADESKIAAHACEKYSGRVGRAAFAKELDPKAVRLAVIAHIRHVHTGYDRLLAAGAGRHEARDRVGGRIDSVLGKWEAVRLPSGIKGRRHIDLEPGEQG